jgi:hypothetical protein
MKFTIELKTFTKMIKTVGKKMPGQKKADADVGLSACAARVFVAANQTVAGIEALVFEDGQCVLDRKRFVYVLETYKGKKHLTIEVGEKWLKIGGFSLAIRDYAPQAKPPGEFQVFPVTDLAALFPDTQPSEAGAEKFPSQSPPIAAPQSGEARLNQLAAEELAENPPRFFPSEEAAMAWFSLPEGELFSIPDDKEVFEHVIGYVRRICTLPKIKPQELVGLARALYAVERLPRTTPGVAVEFKVGVRWGTETEHSENWVTLCITDQEFRAGRMETTRDPNVGGDHCTTTVFEIGRESYRIPQYEGDSTGWMKVLEWMSFVDSLLAGDKTNLLLWVSDESEPDCMAGEAE